VIRIRTETHTIPEETYTETFYGCPQCNFEASSTEDVQVHYGKTHAVKDIKTVGNTECYLIESEYDFEAWWNARDVIDIQKPSEFKGPGWYYVECKLERCPRNCCNDLASRARPISDLLSELEDSAAKLIAESLKLTRLQAMAMSGKLLPKKLDYFLETTT